MSVIFCISLSRMKTSILQYHRNRNSTKSQWFEFQKWIFRYHRASNFCI